jgi:hypothetical protein
MLPSLMWSPNVATMRTRMAKVLGASLLVLTVAGCDEHITDAVIVTNQTSVPLRFEIDLVDGRRSFDLGRTAAPGESIRLLEGSQLNDGALIMKGRCTVSEIRATGPDGEIVDRIPPPICAPAEVVIDGLPPPS